MESMYEIVENPNIPPLNFGLTSPIELIVLADYFAKNGDDRLKTILDEKIKNYVSNPNFSLEDLIERANFDPEDIMFMAEQELNEENPINQKINNIISNR